MNFLCVPLLWNVAPMPIAGLTDDVIQAFVCVKGEWGEILKEEIKQKNMRVYIQGAVEITAALYKAAQVTPRPLR